MASTRRHAARNCCAILIEVPLLSTLALVSVNLRFSVELKPKFGALYHEDPMYDNAGSGGYSLL